jgi:hypothetical protein
VTWHRLQREIGRVVLRGVLGEIQGLRDLSNLCWGDAKLNTSRMHSFHPRSNIKLRLLRATGLIPWKPLPPEPEVYCRLDLGWELGKESSILRYGRGCVRAERSVAQIRSCIAESLCQCRYKSAASGQCRKNKSLSEWWKRRIRYGMVLKGGAFSKSRISAPGSLLAGPTATPNR